MYALHAGRPDADRANCLGREILRAYMTRGTRLARGPAEPINCAPLALRRYMALGHVRSFGPVRQLNRRSISWLWPSNVRKLVIDLFTMLIIVFSSLLRANSDKLFVEF